MKQITMADIAKEMNVSKATVSRALNGKSEISDELRKQIIAKCHEMGYAINYNAKALSSKRKQIIGILVNELMNNKGEFFYKEIYTNIVIELEKKGYTSILKIVSNDEQEELTVPDFLKNQMVDGVIIVGELSKTYVNNLDNYKKPIVLVDFDLGDLRHDSVVTNNIASMAKVTKEFIDRGYANIVFVGNEKLTNSICERYWAYQMEMQKVNLETTIIEDIHHINEEPVFKLEDFSGDVFLCNNDYSAYRLIEFFKDNGIEVPTQKKVVGFDNTFYSEISRPEISTCDVRRDSMATSAIDLLFERIEDPQRTVTNVSLNANFLEKKST